MSWKRTLKREGYVALHAQTWRFRVVKYVILITIGILVFEWKSWPAVLTTFGTLFVLAIAVHFLFRYKTNAWTKSWGPYKKIDIPE